MPYTQVDDELAIVVCDDCGAYASSEEDVKHWPSCKSGESEEWCKYYESEHTSEEVSDA